MTNKQEIRNELKEKGAIQAVKNSEGGIIIIDATLKDIKTAMEGLAFGYRKASHMELIALCAKLEEKMATYAIFNGIDQKVGIIQTDLEEALKLDPDM